MACDITQGRRKPCKNSLAGVGNVIFINYIENAFTVVNGEATAINPLVTEAFKYDLIGDTSNLAQSMVSSSTNGTSANTITLTLALNKITAEDNNQVNLLAYGYPIAVVKDRNGLYHAVGLSDGLDLTAAPTTGAAKADFNGYNLTFTSVENQLAPILDADTVTALLALVEEAPSV